MDIVIPVAGDGTGKSVVFEGVIYRPFLRNSSDHLLVGVGTPFVPTSVGEGQMIGAVGYQRYQLPVGNCKAVSIAALPTNTGVIWLGSINVLYTTGRVLSKGDSIDIAIDYLQTLAFIPEIGGDGISWLLVN
jgi:hypothetical protein